MAARKGADFLRALVLRACVHKVPARHRSARIPSLYYKAAYRASIVYHKYILHFRVGDRQAVEHTSLRAPYLRACVQKRLRVLILRA